MYCQLLLKPQCPLHFTTSHGKTEVNLRPIIWNSEVSSGHIGWNGMCPKLHSATTECGGHFGIAAEVNSALKRWFIAKKGMISRNIALHSLGYRIKQLLEYKFCYSRYVLHKLTCFCSQTLPNDAGFEVSVYEFCAATKQMDFGDKLEYIIVPFPVAILSKNW